MYSASCLCTAERVARHSLTRFQRERSGTDRCGCGRVLSVSSFPFQSPIPFMRFDVTTEVTVTTWTYEWLRAAHTHAHARTLTHRVQAHKQNERVLLECQSGILVFFARTPQNMYVHELHANDRCGNSPRRVSGFSSPRIRLSARVVRSPAPWRLDSRLEIHLSILTLALPRSGIKPKRFSPFVPHGNRERLNERGNYSPEPSRSKYRATVHLTYKIEL